MTIVDAAFAMLGLAAFLAFFRLVRGPSLTDRVVALDVLGLISVGVVAVAAISFDEGTLIDVALVLALIAFLTTVAFAHYIARRSN